MGRCRRGRPADALRPTAPPGPGLVSRLDRRAGGANQSAPLLVSSAGRYVWSERPFTYAFDAGALTVDGEAEVVLGSGREPTLRSAFRAASARFFPADGRAPGAAMFAGPQWNTWIEMPYDESSQDRVLAYARGVVDEGFPPGVLMIDDRWSVDYGNWAFDVARFPDPAAMTAELHRLGFPVMVWLVPFVSPTARSRAGWSTTAADHRSRRRAGGPATGGTAGARCSTSAIRPHWIGSAPSWIGCATSVSMVSSSTPATSATGGPATCRRPAAARPTTCEAWAGFAAEYEFNELRACWKMGGRPLAQRLHDKPPIWGRDGLRR